MAMATLRVRPGPSRRAKVPRSVLARSRGRLRPVYGSPRTQLGNSTRKPPMAYDFA